MVGSIAVLGGGNGGHAIAADLSLAGFKVNIFELPQFVGESFREVMRRGEIEILGKAREGVARLNKATTSISEALDGVELALIAVPAFGHATFAEICAEHLKKASGRPPALALMPGTAGSLEFMKTFREKGVKAPIAETATLPYGCRMLEPAKVIVYVAAKLLPAGVLPARQTEEIVGMLKQLYDAVCPCRNVLEAALNNPNPITHPAATLLNVGRIEYAKGEFYLYKEGITASVARIYEALNRERNALCQTLNLKIFECGEQLTEMDRIIQMGLLFGAGCWEEAGVKMKGPTRVRDRYVTEDVPYGLVFMASLADMLGVPAPVMKSIVTLFSAINREDYFAKGRTVEKLGIAGLSLQELEKYLQEGER
ncbi:MAG: NAD/NADP octopine/nopaline dehydrogenase family protein [Candidatus Hecatellaceae archaeon]